jgi:hypothetical protein
MLYSMRRGEGQRTTADTAMSVTAKLGPNNWCQYDNVESECVAAQTRKMELARIAIHKVVPKKNIVFFGTGRFYSKL